MAKYSYQFEGDKWFVEAYHHLLQEPFPAWLEKARLDGQVSNLDGGALMVETMIRPVRVNIGDWIILGVDGMLVPCANYIFKSNYEAVKA